MISEPSLTTRPDRIRSPPLTTITARFSLRPSRYAREACALRVAGGRRRSRRNRVGERRAAEDLAIDALEQRHQALLDRRPHHQHATALLRRKLAIVEIVAILRDERSTKLSRQTVMLTIRCPSQFFMFEHEEHIPPQHLSHEGHESGRHVRVNVHSGLSRDLLGVTA